MTIDEAISHALEVAGEQQERADSAELIDILDGLDVEACKQCAADHRQLAEWLTNYKEAIRLLKAAVKDINFYVDCFESHCDECCCDHDNHCHWKHEAEALKLIGDSEN